MESRTYKDSLFKFIFGREENKRHLLSLYNALSGSDCADENELELTTIESIIYVTRKNDVSFMIGSEMYLLEQQSSVNPNMPLRGQDGSAPLGRIRVAVGGLRMDSRDAKHQHRTQRGVSYWHIQ